MKHLERMRARRQLFGYFRDNISRPHSRRSHPNCLSVQPLFPTRSLSIVSSHLAPIWCLSLHARLCDAISLARCVPPSYFFCDFFVLGALVCLCSESLGFVWDSVLHTVSLSNAVFFLPLLGFCVGHQGLSST